jgi:hypothetical protein
MKITDEMIELAKAAYDDVYSAEYEVRGYTDNMPNALRAAIEAAAPLIAAVEREACAKIAKIVGEQNVGGTGGVWAERVADAIRARRTP